MKIKFFTLGALALVLLSFPVIALVQDDSSDPSVLANTQLTTDTGVTGSVANVPTSGVLRQVSVENLQARAVALDEKQLVISEKKVLFEASKDAYVTAIADYKVLPSQERFQVALEKAKEHLNNTIDAIVEYLREALLKVQDNPQVSFETETEVTAKINAQIDDLLALKATVDDASTKEDITGAISLVNIEVSDARQLLVRSHRGFFVDRMQGVLAKSFEIALAMQNRIDYLNEQGVDTSTLQGLQDQYEIATSAATSYFEQARELYNNDGDPQEVQSLLNAGKDQVKAAHAELRAFVQLYAEISA